MTPPPLFARHHRSGLTRAKTGCLTCRRRRKKCDEQRPSCRGCIRNHFQCIWPNQLEFGSDNPEPRDHEAPEAGGSHPLSESPSATDAGETARTPDRGSSNSHLHVPEIRSLNQPPRNAELPIKWQPETKCFLSTERASLQSPTSRLMLQHYLHVTSGALAAKPLSSNPFLTHVMPIACCDDLLMHALLALSGSHISFHNSGSADVRLQTQHHYSFVISSLRHEFSDLSSLHGAKSLRLLLVLMILCHVEIVSDVCEGAMFAHLRASRYLIVRLNQRTAAYETPEEKDIYGFVLEVYAYLVSVSYITPYGTRGSSTLPVDEFVTSLHALQEFDVSGCFFACGFALFEKIPLIAQLYRLRLGEQMDGQMANDDVLMKCNELKFAITGWQSPAPPADMAEFRTQHEITGEIYRHALLIYLELAIHGLPLATPKVIYQIQQHVDKILSIHPGLLPSPYESVLMWPAMMLASCLIKEDQRQYMLQKWLILHCRMNHIAQAISLLKLLWEDDDEQAYGPLGLHLMMEKHSINLCMA